MRRTCQNNLRGFTLIELLIVMSVICVLVSILLPVISGMRASANVVICQSHERQLMQAFLQFASDHDNCLPGNEWDSIYQEPVYPYRRDWLLGNNPNQGNEALQVLDGPQKGTIYPYINDMSVYLCPAYQAGALNSGATSNGRFDYAAFIVFAGARVPNIKLYAQVRYNGIVDSSVFTPIICEEDPSGGINGGNVEGGHCNCDMLGHFHRGGGHYTSIDGACHWYKEAENTGGQYGAWEWYSKGPSGNYATLGSVPNTQAWGFWNHQ